MKKRILSSVLTVVMMLLVVLPAVGQIPGTEPVKGILRTKVVTDVTELRAAMTTAVAGDEIVLTSGVYDVSTLTGTRAGLIQARDKKGTAENPIVLRSEDPKNPARIKSTNVSSGMIVHIWGGEYWIVQDLEVEGGQKGIMLDDTKYSVVRGNHVFGCGQEAIHLRDGSSYNISPTTELRIQGCTMQDTEKGFMSGMHTLKPIINSIVTTTRFLTMYSDRE
ncbi:MAG: hypothetical protein FWG33_01930 [Oscillospiraceae bacterium]|nr:hypothetical protein [Oscillospiraceae bacterium]